MDKEQLHKFYNDYLSIKDGPHLETSLWYELTMTALWLDIPNYSELSRITKIPRREISKVVKETLKRYSLLDK